MHLLLKCNGTSLEIMHESFQTKKHYNLRYTSQFFVNPIHSVYNGTDQHRIWGQKYGRKYSLKFEIRSPLKVLSKRSKNGNQRTALLEFVKSLHQT